MELEQLKEQIKVVALVRKASDEADLEKDKAYAEWVEAHTDLINAARVRREVVVAEETKLRELTLQAYAETGNKEPAPGVGIREITKLDYDQKVAYLWGLDHRMALKLDTTAFEKIAKVSPLDFVTIIGEARATIASDLSGYLPVVEGKKE